MTMTRGAAGYARGAGAYARVGVESGVMSASPHQLISMLFDGAGTAIRAAALHMRDGQVAEKGNEHAEVSRRSTRAWWPNRQGSSRDLTAIQGN